MLYRRTPRNPPTLLLRIVASAGAGTLIGMASCGGETTTANGSIALPPSASSDPQFGNDDSGAPPTIPMVTGSIGGCQGICTGLLPEDDGGPVGVVPCDGFCGQFDAEPFDGSADTPDASVADVEFVGSVPVSVDAGYDAHHPIGVVVEPPDSGSTITCPPLCGIVIGLGVNPGH
jgi:hypothetical protein